MNVNQAIENRLELLSQVGKAALNVMFPKEFELYMCALELTDQSGKTLKYFIFPIMPSGIDEGKPQLNNIKKTAGGVTVLSSPTFNPTTITLTGNFGRSFKAVLGTDLSEFASSFTADSGQVTAGSLLSGVGNFFSNDIKTGYGCIKVLEDIIYQSQQVDSKGIRRLIFYNLALGNNYLVKTANIRLNQTESSNNMIWNYTLQLTSVASLEAIMTQKELKQQEFRLVTTGIVQSQLNKAINSIGSALKSVA